MKKAKESTVKFKAFDISTQYTIKEKSEELLILNTYNHQLFDFLFRNILKLNKEKRKFKNDEVTLNLSEYKQSNHTHIMQGVFTTARHGELKQTININTQKEIIEKEIQPVEGVKNEIRFTLDKRNGLILIQEDKTNHVISRNILKSFIYQHRNLVYPYIDKINNKNKNSKFCISKRSFYSIASLPPVDFFEKLKEFKSIKSASLFINSSERDNPIDVVAALENELNENNLHDFNLEIKIKNKSPLGMVKTFKKYFEKISELQKYDSYAIEGKTEAGSTKKITPDSYTREFESVVKRNGKGLFNEEQLIEAMQKVINSEDNPLLDSKNTFDSNLLLKGDDLEIVQKEAEELIESANNNKEAEGQVELHS